MQPGLTKYLAVACVYIVHKRKTTNQIDDYSAAHAFGGIGPPVSARCNLSAHKELANSRPRTVSLPLWHKYPASIATRLSSVVPVLWRRRKNLNIRSCSQNSSTTDLTIPNF